MATLAIHTFQDEVTETGNGTEYLLTYSCPQDLIAIIDITGTATTRTVVFEGAGENGNYIAIQATNLNSNASANQTNGTSDELWKINITGLSKIRCRVHAIGTGNLKIVGKIVGG